MDSIVIKGEDTKPSPEGHDEKMIALVDSKSQENPSPSNERPAWLPEKFKTVEDMAKAYSELEKKQSQQRDKPKEEATPPVQPEDKPKDTPEGETPSESQVKEELASKNLDFSEFQQEMTAKGELSAESYEKLEKAGYPRYLVDQYIEGRVAQNQLYEANLKSSVGGEEAFKEMSAWAALNLGEKELNAYNEAVTSGDAERARLALLGVHAKFTAEVGTTPKLISGATNGGSSGADVFESTAQVTAAMKDPRYKADPAYRASVAAKLQRSKVW